MTTPRFVNIIVGYGPWYEVIATPKHPPFWEVSLLLDGNQQGPSKLINIGDDLMMVSSVLMRELQEFTARKRR